MKRKAFVSWYLLFLSFFFPTNSQSQNLVPNPGFELYDSLPCNFTQYSGEFGLHIQDWFLPTAGTSDIVSTQISSACLYGNPLSQNSCGPQYPLSGDAMVGMVADLGGWEEYVQVQLTAPLIPGKRYYLEWYILLGVCSNFACNNYGAALGMNQYYDTLNASLINIQPVVHDSTIKSNTVQWEKISGCFAADSAYQYLILGHFQNNCDSSTLSSGVWPVAYYFIDDVFLAEDSTCELTEVGCKLDNQISSFSKPEFKWYIESDQLKVSLKDFNGTFSVFSSEGKKVLSAKSNENSASVDLYTFSQGLYICVFYDEKGNGVSSFKFVKN